MRTSLTAASAFLLLVILAGCVPQPAGSPAHPNPIIVREFTYSLGVITLDPSFGFSLYRGGAGVPPRQRAAGVGRAAAFSLADSITEQLITSGYDAIRSDDATPEPGRWLSPARSGRSTKVAAGGSARRTRASPSTPKSTTRPPEPRRSASPRSTSIRGRSRAMESPECPRGAAPTPIWPRPGSGPRSPAP